MNLGTKSFFFIGCFYYITIFPEKNRLCIRVCLIIIRRPRTKIKTGIDKIVYEVKGNRLSTFSSHFKTPYFKNFLRENFEPNLIVCCVFCIYREEKKPFRINKRKIPFWIAPPNLPKPFSLNK